MLECVMIIDVRMRALCVMLESVMVRDVRLCHKRMFAVVWCLNEGLCVMLECYVIWYGTLCLLVTI